jgi:hypothetical protein
MEHRGSDNNMLDVFNIFSTSGARNDPKQCRSVEVAYTSYGVLWFVDGLSHIVAASVTENDWTIAFSYSLSNCLLQDNLSTTP